MQAPRSRRADAIPSKDHVLFLDFLYITFTATVAIILGKFFVTNTALEMVDFFENEEFWTSRMLVVASLVLILVYSAHFFHRGRDKIITAIAREYLRSGRSNVRKFRSSFSWLRHLLAVLEPSPEVCKYIHEAFKYFFTLCEMLLVSLIGSFMCTGKEIDFFIMNVFALAIYITIAFSMGGYSAERVLAHLGYSLLHVGTAVYYYDYEELSYICINAGVAVFMLCLVWYFVNVPSTRRGRS